MAIIRATHALIVETQIRVGNLSKSLKNQVTFDKEGGGVGGHRSGQKAPSGGAPVVGATSAAGRMRGVVGRSRVGLSVTGMMTGRMIGLMTGTVMVVAGCIMT